MRRVAMIPEKDVQAGEVVTTNVRIRRDQLHAVQDEAIRRMRERGTGRADHSEIYREALDLWFREHGA